jgi:NAD+ kinase
MNKFCVITNRDKDNNMEVTNNIVDYMAKKQKDCVVLEGLNPLHCEHHFTDADGIPEDTECAIVLGGDGTIIQAANDIAAKGIPILGINLGTLGFLAEIEKHNLYEALDSLITDQCSFESRMMLYGNIIRNIRDVYSGFGLFDFVISSSGFS